MPEKNRTFEVDIQNLQVRRLPTRLADEKRAGGLSGARPASPARPQGPAFSRETILRLIEWLKQE